MESIINAMEAIKGALDYLQEVTEGEARRMAAEALELAESVKASLEKMTATRQETAALIAETVKATLRPVDEEETDEQSNRKE